jgi:hypothetical protein
VWGILLWTEHLQRPVHGRGEVRLRHRSLDRRAHLRGGAAARIWLVVLTVRPPCQDRCSSGGPAGGTPGTGPIAHLYLQVPGPRTPGSATWGQWPRTSTGPSGLANLADTSPRWTLTEWRLPRSRAFTSRSQVEIAAWSRKESSMREAHRRHQRASVTRSTPNLTTSFRGTPVVTYTRTRDAIAKHWRPEQ